MSFNNSKAVQIYADKTALFPIEETIFRECMGELGAVLDLGCGTGRTSRPLTDMGHSVIGVDVAPLMISKAREMHPDIVFHVGNATKLKFRKRTFDYALFSFNGLDCLYPVEERLEALREIYRVLKVGGVFIYSSHDSEAVKLNWRTLTRVRNYGPSYKKERTVYGDLVLYYGTRAGNIQQLKQARFNEIRFYPLEGKMWRYYTCRKM